MAPTGPSESGSIRIRRAEPDDLRSMARVHVETWKSAYRGLIPNNRLDTLTVESDIAGGFGSYLKQPPPGLAEFVAVTTGGEVIGFAMGGPAREPEPGYTGELGSIYVLSSHQRQGVGSALVGEIARHLLGTGHTTMMVWVMEPSPYRRFYEHLGGALHRRALHPSRIAGGPVSTVSYVWGDIRQLSGL